MSNLSSSRHEKESLIWRLTISTLAPRYYQPYTATDISHKQPRTASVQQQESSSRIFGHRLIKVQFGNSLEKVKYSAVCGT
jgi:hypothetical protein